MNRLETEITTAQESSSRSTDAIDSELKQEAYILCNYLIKERPRLREVELYSAAIGKLQIYFDDTREKRIWQVMMTKPWTIGLFDGALVLTDPHSLIRKRIFTMLAILETSPNFTKHFILDGFHKFQLFGLGLRMCFSVLKSFFGLIFLKSYGILWW